MFNVTDVYMFYKTENFTCLIWSYDVEKINLLLHVSSGEWMDEWLLGYEDASPV